VGLSPAQRQLLTNWMRSRAIVQCPTCGHDKWHFDDAAYVRCVQLREILKRRGKGLDE